MNQSVFFTTETIANFLLQYGKKSTSKDYEFIIAVMLKNYCEKQWGERCKIGFEFKPTLLAKLPRKDTFELELERVAELLRDGINEDTPIDCIIVPENPDEKGYFRGCGFQIKRFGIGQETVDTNSLIEFINSLKHKYSKSDTCLVIIFDGKEGEVEFPRVKNEIDASNFPFRRLMFGWRQDNKIYFGEIHPEYGIEEYNPRDIIA